MTTGALAGKTVLVTGAGRGIGWVIARTCAEAGARVIATARSWDRESLAMLESLNVVPMTLDVTDTASVEALAARVRDEVGELDGLVANSGVAGPTSPLWSISDAEWDNTIEVNLTGVFRCLRAFLPTMVERGEGSVVCVGSVSGRLGLPGRTPYSASKAGLVGLVRSTVLDLGDSGVRINTVSPGAVDGDRFRDVVRRQAEAAGRSEEETLKSLSGRAPLGRVVAPEEVAAAVIYLLTDGSAAVTGIDLAVAGGYPVD